MKQLDVFNGPIRSTSYGIMRLGKTMRRPLTAGILILAMVAQFGCTSSKASSKFVSSKFVKMSTHDLFPDAPEEVVLPLPDAPEEVVLPPLREAIRLGLGKVAVTSGRFAPSWVDPAKTETRDWSFADDFADHPLSATIEILLTSPLILPLLFLAPSMALHAWLTKPTEAKPTEAEVRETNERLSGIREIVEFGGIQDDLRDRVVAMSRAQTPHTFVALADRGPTAAGEQPDYRPLSEEGVQTVLEVVVERVMLNGVELSGSDRANLPLALRMTVKTRIVRAVDNTEIYANSLTFIGGKERTLAEWAGDPEGFRDELNRAYAEIAERTVEEIFPRTESN